MGWRQFYVHCLAVLLKVTCDLTIILTYFSFNRPCAPKLRRSTRHVPIATVLLASNLGHAENHNKI
jgi:hypothetical protein